MPSGQAEEERRAGLPAPSSIVDAIPFNPPGAGSVAGVVPGGAAAAYTILRTTETDGYEPDLTPAAVLAPAPAPPGNDFRGTARRRAKTSLSSASIETFADVADLIATLPAHDFMDSLNISEGPNSGRVVQERRNIRATAFLYAHSREDDNDYHLIIGRAPGASPPLFMTIEISGLPPSTSPDHDRLSEARTAYKDFFGARLPGESYDYPQPPVPIEIEGSLFWDARHAMGPRPGPQSLRPNMPVVWEVHPVSKIVFEP